MVIGTKDVIEFKDKEHNNIITDPVTGVMSGEVMAFCPDCKAVQTLSVVNGQLIPTRKYTQQENRIYHDCGALKPCRLYRTF